MPSPANHNELDPGVFTSRLKLKHLILLRNVAELQTLRKGAAASNMTQPAATKLIQELEALFGVALFHRDRQGMTLTLYGERVRQHVDILLTDIDRLREGVDMLAQGITGQIRVGVVPSIAPALLTQSIVRILQERPKVRFIIQEASTTALLASMHRNELDLILGRVLDADQAQGMKVTHVYAEAFTIVCAKQHVLSQRKNPSWTQMAQFRWVLPPSGTPMRQMVDNIFTQNLAIRPEAAVESSSFGQMRDLIGHSNLLGIVPRSIAAQPQSREILDVLKNDVGTHFTPISLIYRSDIDQPPLIDIFADTVSETAAAMGLGTGRGAQ
ncbi:LysR substrate-binding domain-containing protein [Marinobacterium rhizophilum]|uniref:LysR family transcriptional regulator n=1 Tax=Marinobacterium rhizophilum TaxID=420402 RepID=A0ABY5HMU1_9GAMM|nr:LysR substrate-binding domain-containing protein [Marinobacterium rhizophilum]UTW13117.1 LysR family transcriptional regulator [Marinobacterium rhizophilum]